MEILRRAQRLRVTIVFVDPTLLSLVSFSFSVISFGLACAVCPSIGLSVVSCGCYIYIAGRKPISREEGEVMVL